MIFPVEGHIETLLVESEHSLCKLRFKVILGVDVLAFKCVARVGSCFHFPAVESVDFVQRDAERCIFVLQQLDGFKRLVFKTVHNIND